MSASAKPGMTWLASSGTGPLPWLRVEHLSVFEPAFIFDQDAVLRLDHSAVPALRVSDLTVRCADRSAAPSQARPIPAAITRMKPSHSESALPRWAGRWAASATDTGLVG